MTPPLVSCILPTRDRPDLIAIAADCFLRQDYEPRELVIVDDGVCDVASELPSDDRIRYLRVPEGMSLGAKYNFACSQAQGAMIAQWNDDDWYGPSRLSAQILPLIANECDLTALDTDLVFDLEKWNFWRPGAGWKHAGVAGVNARTLAFPARAWEESGGYPESGPRDDEALLSRLLERGARLRTIQGRGLFLYVRHGDNTGRLAGPVLETREWEAADELELPGQTRVDYEKLSAVRSDLGSLPLVSCIMPTAERRALVPQAIQRFLEQDYPQRELIIIDDGDSPVENLVPRDPRIRYLRLAGRRTTGAKRNVACQQAHGDLIAHWDDDDWMAPWRLSYQVRELLAARADVCGLDRVYFWEPQRDELWRYAYPSGEKPWVAGGTMLYRRSFWRKNPFPEIQMGEDNAFVWSDRAKRVLRLDDQRFYVATIHVNNTSPKQISADRWQQRPSEEVRELMGKSHEVYRSLFRPPAPPQGRAIRRASPPLMSCILATEGRPRFVRQAIRYYLRQTRRNTELIVVDNGEPGVESLCSGLLGVRYVSAPPGTTLGAKLNLGIRHSRGRILQKMDDDDFYHPEFLEVAAGALQEAGPSPTIVAWDCFMVMLAGEAGLRFSGHGWAAGGTLCFRRELWERTPFRDVPSEVDKWLLEDAQATVRRVCAPELYVLVRHGRNTWNKTGVLTPVDDMFRGIESSGRVIHDLVEPIDRPFYEALARGEVRYA